MAGMFIRILFILSRNIESLEAVEERFKGGGNNKV